MTGSASEHWRGPGGGNGKLKTTEGWHPSGLESVPNTLLFAREGFIWRRVVSNVETGPAKQPVKNTSKPAVTTKLKASTSAGGYRVYGTLVRPRKRSVMRITAAIQKLI